MSNPGNLSRDEIMRRATLYLHKLPPSIQGQNGNGALFAAAVAVAHGFNLDEQAAADLLLMHFNPRADPPWSESELRRVVKQAKSKAHDKPAGHLLNSSSTRQSARVPTTLQQKAERYAKTLALNPRRREQLAAMLGVPIDALAKVDLIGYDSWDRTGSVWTWPERDGAGVIIGITYRTESGAKKSMKGSKRGLVLPHEWQNGTRPLLILEGFSDCLASLATGITSIARPSKSLKPAAAAEMIGAAVRSSPHPEIIIVADVDDTTEAGNAAQIAALLARRLPGREVRWAVPPDSAKDVREWFTKRPEGETWPDRGRAFLDALQLREPPAAAEQRPDPTATGTPSTGNDCAVIIGTDEHRVNDEVAAELAKDQNLYQRNGEIVRVIVETPTPDGPRLSTTPRIEAVPGPALRDNISRRVSFKKWIKGGEDSTLVPAHPPDWCISAVGARGTWPGIRPLVGVVSFPTLRPDGSVLTSPGYDPATGIFLHWTQAPLSIPEAPAVEDARAAAAELLDAVADFPFKDEMHKAAWLAALLTPLARPAFDGPAPLFLVDANVRAAGKGMSLEVISRIVTGNPFPVVSYPVNPKDCEEELRKKITTLLLYGDRVALFDNLTGEFGDGTLDRALTGTEWQDRILGANRQYRGPLFVTFFATGNNVLIRADTARRICHIRLESPHERPEERNDFKRPHVVRWVMENRENLLRRALTILRAYHLAGRPGFNLKPWGSYESWSALVRNAIVWCGLPDPGETRDVIQEQADETLRGLRQLIAALDIIDPERNGLTAAEIVGAAYDENSPHSPEVREMLRDAIGSLVVKPEARKLGNKLRHHKPARVVDGQYIDLAGEDTKRVNRWAVFDGNSLQTRPQTHAPHTPHTPNSAPASPPSEDVEDVEDVSAPDPGAFFGNTSDGVPPWKL